MVTDKILNILIWYLITNVELVKHRQIFPVSEKKLGNTFKDHEQVVSGFLVILLKHYKSF